MQRKGKVTMKGRTSILDEEKERKEIFILTLFKETQVGICFLIYTGRLRFYDTRKMLLISYCIAHKENILC
jgi:hypothetical protein